MPTTYVIELLRMALMIGIAALAVLTDVRERRIPNRLTGPLAVAGLAIGSVGGGLAGFVLAAAGSLVGGLVFLIPVAKLGWGMGDLKLAAALGAMGGPLFALWMGLYALAAGGLFAMIWLRLQGQLAPVAAGIGGDLRRECANGAQWPVHSLCRADRRRDADRPVHFARIARMSAMRERVRRLARPRRGQALVETALILPIFLLVVFATLDLGRIVFLKSELENAVREGARVGMVSQPFSQTAVRDRIQAQPGLANATVNASCSGGCEYGSTVTVTATLPVSVVVGLVPALPSLTIGASASVRIG